MQVTLNIEQQMLKVVHESIVQTFRQHKNLVERELTLAINSITMLRKDSKSAEAISSGFDKQINKLKLVRARYQKLTQEEAIFQGNLQVRASHLA